MTKTFRLFGLVALSLVLFGCQPGSNDNNDPELPVKSNTYKNAPRLNNHRSLGWVLSNKVSCARLF